MVHLDTNFLIAALVADSPEDGQLRKWLVAGEPVGISVIVWAEFLCGPATPTIAELASLLFDSPEPLLDVDAGVAAELFNLAGRRRGSFADCLIAATCLRQQALLATNNVDDFRRFESAGLRIAEI